jgi:CBS-domain-containing membrane protein
MVDIVIREGVRTLPVVDKNGGVVGIITDNDLLRRGGLAIRLGLLTALTPEERASLTRNGHQRCARDVMTTPVITIRNQATLKEAITQFGVHDIKRLPVVNEHQHLVGIVTRSDVLRELTFSETPLTWALETEPSPLGWNAPVEQVMITNVPVVEPTASLDNLIQKMLNAAQQRIIVTDTDQKVIGMVTDGDVLKHVPVDVRPGLLNWLTALWTGDPSKNPSTQLSQSNLTAADVMTTPIRTIQAGTSLRKALEVLMQYRIKRLPVVDTEGHLLGLVGRAGLIQALMTEPILADPTQQSNSDE